ncbi:hypothetical protein J2S21_004521 [Peribacillus cavernae]|nr:hypothetical protein [Peribacillus cavernae]
MYNYRKAINQYGQPYESLNKYYLARKRIYRSFLPNIKVVSISLNGPFFLRWNLPM